MAPFERPGRCSSCDQEFVVKGASLFPGMETEGPARFHCVCGGFVEALLPGSVNRDRVDVVPKGGVPAS
jgi:hypothetical protein